MSPEYTDLTTQEVGTKAAALNISGRPESLMEFIVWAQRRALASTALSEITQASEAIGGYDLAEDKC